MTSIRHDGHPGLDIRLVVGRDEVPHDIWSIHHRPLDLRVQLFFCEREACAVATRMARNRNWRSLTTVPTGMLQEQLMAEVWDACLIEGLERRSILSEETRAFIAFAWGSPDTLHAVDAAEDRAGSRADPWRPTP